MPGRLVLSRFRSKSAMRSAKITVDAGRSRNRTAPRSIRSLASARCAPVPLRARGEGPSPDLQDLIGFVGLSGRYSSSEGRPNSGNSLRCREEGELGYPPADSSSTCRPKARSRHSGLACTGRTSGIPLALIAGIDARARHPIPGPNHQARTSSRRSAPHVVRRHRLAGILADQRRQRADVVSARTRRRSARASRGRRRSIAAADRWCDVAGASVVRAAARSC